MQIVRCRMIEGEESNGCELAPVEIMKELRKIKKIDLDRINLEEIHVDLENHEEANHLIYENSKEIFEMNDRAFFIGGDNSINYSLVSGFNKIVSSGLLIVFDSETNCGNGSWVRRLAENGMNGRNIVLIGCRNFSEAELNFIREEEITLIKMDVLNEDLGGVCDAVMERANSASGFYVNVNISSVDPAFAPGVSSISSCGMSSNDLLYFLGRLRLLKGFRGGGVVGVNPTKDVNNMTVNLGARLLSEMIK